jgi:amino-acid N-acetyltransferase
MVVEAMSLYADGALLRSVAVNFTVQGQRLGHRLSEAALRMAQARAVQTVFLLMTTADRFFARLGFELVTRDGIPTSVLTSVEFRSACPASAVVMRKRLALSRSR